MRWVKGLTVAVCGGMVKFECNVGPGLETIWLDAESAFIAKPRSRTDNPVVQENEMLHAFKNTLL